MKRFALIIMTIATIFAQQVHAQYYSVNFDAKTVAAMVAAYGTGTVAEAYYDEQVQNILNPLAELSQCILDSSNGSIINVI